MAEASDVELDVIAVGAHPDDVEIACGGTLARLARKGYQVGIVDLTDGEPTPLLAGSGRPPGRGAARRRDPRASRSGSTSTCPTAGSSTRFEARVALAKVFRRHGPRSCSASAARPCSPRPTTTRRC